MTVNRRLFMGLAAASGTATMVPSWALGQGTADFSGKTVELTIPYGEGGGTDAWARFFANHLGRHLPGNPTVLVRNVPGGGGLSGANAFAQRMPDDGLSILGVSASNQFPYLLGDPRVQYEYKDFTPVLVSPSGGVVYIPGDYGVADMSEGSALLDREFVFANTGATSLDLVLMLAFDILGLNVRHVFGMSSRGETRLAFERGEANIDYQTSSSYLANIVPMVESGAAVPLFTVGALDAEGNVVRDPTFPDLPHFLEAYEMMHGQPPEQSEKLDAFIAFFSAGFPAQKMILVPNTVEPEILEAYRLAFADAVADPELQANKAEVLGDYVQGTGESALRLYEIATTLSPEATAWMQEYLRSNYNVQI